MDKYIDNTALVMDQILGNELLRLRGSTILITGSTGLIGKHLALALLQYNKRHDAQIKIICLARNQKKAECYYASVLQDHRIRFVYQDAARPIEIEEPVDYIIHAASPTNGKYFINAPVETISTIIHGNENILSFAQDRGCSSVVFLSTTEVYGVPNVEKVTESDYGYLDPLSPRSSYSESKRLAECMCTSWYNENGVPVVIARLAQTFGPGVEYNDQRVFAEFARNAYEGKNIILHSSGETKRNYLYLGDAISAIMTILLKGKAGQAYNVANDKIFVSILEMAQMVATIIGQGQISVKVLDEKDVSGLGYAPTMEINLDTDKIQKLGWKATVGLADMFRIMIDSWKTEGKVNN